MDKEEYERYLALHGLPYKRPRPKLVSLSKDHPFYCMTYKGRLAEARLVMAKHLSRPLTRNEIVCYKDDFPLNTSIDNLELRDRRYMYDDSIEWGLDNDVEGSENYHIGKVEEERIASHLAETGYSVSDISRIRHYNPDGTVTYSPFDIYAWSENYSFLADIKYRKSCGDIYFKSELLNIYNTYWSQLKVSDRIIIIATPDTADSFISVGDITLGDDYSVVERWKTKSISALKALADGKTITDNRKLRYLHIEPDTSSPSGYNVLGVFHYPQNRNR